MTTTTARAGARNRSASGSTRGGSSWNGASPEGHTVVATKYHRLYAAIASRAPRPYCSKGEKRAPAERASAATSAPATVSTRNGSFSRSRRAHPMGRRSG